MPDGAVRVTGELDRETVATPPNKPSMAVVLAFMGTSHVPLSAPLTGSASKRLLEVGSLKYYSTFSLFLIFISYQAWVGL